MKLLAFHNDPIIKDQYLARVRAHAAADEIVSGTYWERGKGCAVGCTIHGDSHAKYETELGIPQVLAWLEDRLFEALFRSDPAAAKAWPERFLNAAKPGADLMMVWPKFAHWLLVDPEHGVIRFAKRDKTAASIQSVAALYERWINGDKPERKEWASAADAASDASAAALAALAALDDRASADALAASADARAARANHYKIMADKLIQLMEAA